MTGNSDKTVFGPTQTGLNLADPINWLARGWRDFVNYPVGMIFGLCFTAGGWALLRVFSYSASWTLALSAGFLLLGPLLCVGLYAISRSLERGEQPQLLSALTAWRGHLGALIPYLVILVILEMLWSRAAMVVFAVSFSSMPPLDSAWAIVMDPDNLGFVITYVAVGALFAGLIFATSVIAIPLILDRDTDGITACLTSIQVCLANPLVMVVWGLLISTLVLVAIIPYFLGLIVIGPLLGHASWHAYRRCVAPMPGAC